MLYDIDARCVIIDITYFYAFIFRLMIFSSPPPPLLMPFALSAHRRAVPRDYMPEAMLLIYRFHALMPLLNVAIAYAMPPPRRDMLLCALRFSR